MTAEDLLLTAIEVMAFLACLVLFSVVAFMVFATLRELWQEGDAWGDSIRDWEEEGRALRPRQNRQ